MVDDDSGDFRANVHSDMHFLPLCGGQAFEDWVLGKRLFDKLSLQIQ